MMSRRRTLIVTAGLLLFGSALYHDRLPGGTALVQRLRGQATVEDRLAQYGSSARDRLKPYFDRQDISYPPSRLALLGFKQEERLEIYAADASGSWKHIRSYPVLRASGKPGPKLEYGDMQVPEGIYRIESLNPNSRYHLSLRLDYPNAFDKKQAKEDGRTNLVGDIMIHGSDVSIGCLAMGDAAIEELFVLTAETGLENVVVILSPMDFRQTGVIPEVNRPKWVTALYRDINSALQDYSVPESRNEINGQDNS